jgi:hypothetical protein
VDRINIKHKEDVCIKIVVPKCKRMSSLGRLGRKWEHSIKVNLTDRVCVGTVLCGSPGS